MILVISIFQTIFRRNHFRWLSLKMVAFSEKATIKLLVNISLLCKWFRFYIYISDNISWLWSPDLFTIHSPVVWTLALHFRSPRRAYWQRQYTRPVVWEVSTTWYIWPWRSCSRTPRSVLKTVALSPLTKKIWNLSISEN